MMSDVQWQELPVWVDGDDREGRLVLAGGRLIAVLVKLNDVDGQPGKWFIEAGFGPAATPVAVTFDNLTEAEDWIRERLADAAAAKS